MKTKSICYNAAYMEYGFISNHSLCTQPPIQCNHEIGEVITLMTGMKLQIFYCAKSKEITESKQKGRYIGITRMEEPSEYQKGVKSEIPTATSCSLSGRK